MTMINFDWRIREVMAQRGLFSTTKLIPLLQQRGIHLSSSQVYRLVTEKPERLNVLVLMALIDILDCRIEDLIVRVEMDEIAEVTGTDGSPKETALKVLKDNGYRPKRAVIVPPPA